MLQKIVLALAVATIIPHAEQLFLVKEYQAPTANPYEPTNRSVFLLLKDDSTFIKATFPINLFKMPLDVVDAWKGRWVVQSDSLKLIGMQCVKEITEAKPLHETFAFANDSILLSGSKRIGIPNNEVLYKRIQNAETEIQDRGKRMFTRFLIGTAAVGGALFLMFLNIK